MIEAADFCIQLAGYIGYILLLIILGGQLGIWMREVQGGFIRLGIKFGHTWIKYETGIGYWSEREE